MKKQISGVSQYFNCGTIKTKCLDLQQALIVLVNTEFVKLHALISIRAANRLKLYFGRLNMNQLCSERQKRMYGL